MHDDISELPDKLIYVIYTTCWYWLFHVRICLLLPSNSAVSCYLCVVLWPLSFILLFPVLVFGLSVPLVCWWLFIYLLMLSRVAKEFLCLIVNVHVTGVKEFVWSCEGVLCLIINVMILHFYNDFYIWRDVLLRQLFVFYLIILTICHHFDEHACFFNRNCYVF